MRTNKVMPLPANSSPLISYRDEDALVAHRPALTARAPKGSNARSAATWRLG